MLIREKYTRRIYASFSSIIHIKLSYLQISLYKRVSLLEIKYIACLYPNYLTFTHYFAILAHYINAAY
jgi:hypothetical protein